MLPKIAKSDGYSLAPSEAPRNPSRKRVPKSNT